MIDRPKRDEAARLVLDFLDGRITSDDLESSWPGKTPDRAIEALSSMIWLFYDDHTPRRMVGRDAASADERTLLTRYAAFLNSECEYDWPESDFMRLSGLGVLVPLSLWLLAPVDRLIKARNARIDDAMEAHGDLTLWPFRDRYQWSGPALTPFVR
jgi:hypothetical protein